MKKTIFILAALLILSLPAQAAVTIQETLAKAVPEDAILFGTHQDLQTLWKNISSSNAWQKIQGFNVWDELGVGSDLSEFKVKFNEKVGLELSEENIMALFGKEVAVALMGGPEAGQVQVLLLAIPADKEKAGGSCISSCRYHPERNRFDCLGGR